MLILLRLLSAILLVSAVAASTLAQTGISDLESAAHQVLSPRPQERRKSLAEDAVSGRRSVGLNSGSASFRISGAAGLISSVGNRAPGEGRWLVMEPNSVRISHAQTTHPTRIKAGKPITCFNTIGMCESKDFIEADDGGEIPKEEYSVVLKVSKILVSLGASVNLTPAATWRNRRALRRAQTSSTTRCSTTRPSFSGGLLPVVEHQKPRREARSKRIH